MRHFGWMRRRLRLWRLRWLRQLLWLQQLQLRPCLRLCPITALRREPGAGIHWSGPDGAVPIVFAWSSVRSGHQLSLHRLPLRLSRARLFSRSCLSRSALCLWGACVMSIRAITALGHICTADALLFRQDRQGPLRAGLFLIWSRALSVGLGVSRAGKRTRQQHIALAPMCLKPARGWQRKATAPRRWRHSGF